MLAGDRRIRFLYALLGGVLIWFFGTIVLTGIGLEAPEDGPLWETYLFLLALWGGQMTACFIWNRKSWVLGYRLSFRLKDAPIGLAVGALTQLVVLPLAYLPLLPFLDLGDVSESAEKLADRAEGAGGVILFALFTVFLAPIVEEIFFRGFLWSFFEGVFGSKNDGAQNNRAKKAPQLGTIVATAAIFAGAHFLLLPLWGLFVVGLILGYGVYKTGRLGLSIWIHIGFNLVAFISLVF